jgi:hypothetical protein
MGHIDHTSSKIATYYYRHAIPTRITITSARQYTSPTNEETSIAAAKATQRNADGKNAA